METMCGENRKRVTFYVDGFNFYYGLRRTKKTYPKWQHYYWLDVVKFFERFIGKDQMLEKVIYFTAPPLNDQKQIRQSAFLNANKLTNGNRFEVVMGKFLEKHVICPYCRGDIIKPEEKKTDVNISVRMIGDCVLNKTDIVSLVSADSDLVPPIEFIQRYFPDKKVKVYFPPSGYSYDLKDSIIHNGNNPIMLIKNERAFDESVMPDEVQVGRRKYKIPDKWK